MVVLARWWSRQVGTPRAVCVCRRRRCRSRADKLEDSQQSAVRSFVRWFG